ncbi:MAG: hypothetical protein PVS3B1_24140 [Ktedonobacteraceae bacterium]
MDQDLMIQELNDEQLETIVGGCHHHSHHHHHSHSHTHKQCDRDDTITTPPAPIPNPIEQFPPILPPVFLNFEK